MIQFIESVTLVFAARNNIASELQPPFRPQKKYYNRVFRKKGTSLFCSMTTMTCVISSRHFDVRSFG